MTSSIFYFPSWEHPWGLGKKEGDRESQDKLEDVCPWGGPCLLEEQELPMHWLPQTHKRTEPSWCPVAVGIGVPVWLVGGTILGGFLRESEGTWGEDQIAQKTAPWKSEGRCISLSPGPPASGMSHASWLWWGSTLEPPVKQQQGRQEASISPTEGIPEKSMEDRSMGSQHLSARGL